MPEPSKPSHRPTKHRLSDVMVVPVLVGCAFVALAAPVARQHFGPAITWLGLLALMCALLWYLRRR
ncbi:hypothetical protein [Corynebacterium aquilae]|uniref:Uncharacterized protein n=1 Tax=Corynebacterium aquilae DSM 44791 TaxID=1431546 RepID=A0A1L7CEJ7_9CORY|nr:hypothetical protein [Corynebacterium aquilae]APT84266.1 hypothetical protein CAQU_03370 [Corynebacterium aquilae DSM 44791]